MTFRCTRRSLAAFGLYLVACATACAQSNALLTSTAPDRAAKLEAAARAEGALMLYTSMPQNEQAALIPPFEKKYGIKTTVWRSSGDSILQRVIVEARAGRNDVDVLHTSSPELEALHEEQLLQPVESPNFPDLIARALPAHKEWVGQLVNVWVLSYNTNLVKKDELPRTYQDLLDPRWKGRLAMESEDQEWFIAVVKAMGEEKGIDYFRKLTASNGLSVRKGHTQLDNFLISGEEQMGLTVYFFMATAAMKEGAPLGWLALEPTFGRVNGTAVMKSARHPNAAALFIDYLLTEGQTTLAALGQVPVSTKVASPFGARPLTIVDATEKHSDSQKWDALYREIVLKSAKR